MEPTYEYVKGQGWVASVGHIVTMACGKRVRLEFRNPKPGEYYNGASPMNLHYFQENGEPVWEAWYKSFQSCRFRSLCHCQYEGDYYSGDKLIVAVPV